MKLDSMSLQAGLSVWAGIQYIMRWWWVTKQHRRSVCWFHGPPPWSTTIWVVKQWKCILSQSGSCRSKLQVSAEVGSFWGRDGGSAPGPSPWLKDGCLLHVSSYGSSLFACVQTPPFFCKGTYYTVLCLLSCCSRVQFFVTPWTVACQGPLSMGFSRQEYCNGWPFLTPDTGLGSTLKTSF